MSVSNKKQKDALKREINANNVMMKKVGQMFKISGLLCIAFILLTFWGFTHMDDPFLHLAISTQDILKWIFLVIAIITGVLSVLSFFSFRNAKKYVLSLIDDLSKLK